MGEAGKECVRNGVVGEVEDWLEVGGCVTADAAMEAKAAGISLKEK